MSGTLETMHSKSGVIGLSEKFGHVLFAASVFDARQIKAAIAEPASGFRVRSVAAAQKIRVIELSKLPAFDLCAKPPRQSFSVSEKLTVTIGIRSANRGVTTTYKIRFDQCLTRVSATCVATLRMQRHLSVFTLRSINALHHNKVSYRRGKLCNLKF